MYPVFAWGLKAAMCGGIDGVIKISKDSAHISCKKPLNLYYFPYNIENARSNRQYRDCNNTRAWTRHAVQRELHCPEGRSSTIWRIDLLTRITKSDTRKNWNDTDYRFYE